MLAALFAGACASDPIVLGEVDASTAGDAGIDASVTVDSGSPRADSGFGVDAAAEVDAGASDSGVQQGGPVFGIL